MKACSASATPTVDVGRPVSVRIASSKNGLPGADEGHVRHTSSGATVFFQIEDGPGRAARHGAPSGSARRQGHNTGHELVGPTCSLAASDLHLVTRGVERHEPVSLKSEPSAGAQDSYRTDSDSFTKPEDGRRSATIAAVGVHEASGRFINPELQSVSPSHKHLTLRGQSLALLARCGFLSLEFFEAGFKRCPPGLCIGAQSLGEAHKRREVCTQVQLILTAGWR